MYCEHGEALEADFFHIYHVDINTCSLRRMRNLFERLTFHSEVHYEINEIPQEARLWGINTYMLADVIDWLRIVEWRLIDVNSKHSPPPPKPMKRPELSAKKKKKNVWQGPTIVDRGTKT